MFTEGQMSFHIVESDPFASHGVALKGQPGFVKCSCGDRTLSHVFLYDSEGERFVTPMFSLATACVAVEILMLLGRLIQQDVSLIREQLSRLPISLNFTKKDEEVGKIFERWYDVTSQYEQKDGDFASFAMCDEVPLHGHIVDSSGETVGGSVYTKHDANELLNYTGTYDHGRFTEAGALNIRRQITASMLPER